MGGLTGIRAVCWDWNGTLLDDVDICIQVMNEVLTEHGEPPLRDAVAYRATFRFPIRDFYSDVGIGPDRFESAVSLYLRRLQARAAESQLQANARQTLDGVRRMGVRQVLASATLPDLLELQMAPHDVAGSFERILAIDDPLRASKREVIGEWLAGSGLAAEQVLLIGDTNHDREIARELGAPFLHFGGDHQVPEGDGRSIDALDDLLRMLRVGLSE